ncbi:type VI secretion system ATPase TssH [Paraburkholderia sp. SARCC-3016]|uniref:type VI secretion system ATPase TssH n=1 Tax=Paraburkholderia sp. SARCC-3016 TaxID=3058611 RepID=UPI002807AEFA|nr:type VI secretion system ATPase TssH [Paraburkholderia sp. SARCC-3016]MDQ7976151.1 type VI secretion system ATPase TssH [Paraburkholderia sp. SARCC-3016]
MSVTNTRDTSALLRRLNPHCARALEAAANLCQARLAGEISVEHWLLKLIEAGDGDVPALLEHCDIDIDALWQALLESIARAPRNLRGKPALSLQAATVLQDAWSLALVDALTDTTGDVIRSSHLLQAIMEAPHVLHTRRALSLLPLSAAQIRRLMPRLGSRSTEHVATPPPVTESATYTLAPVQTGAIGAIAATEATDETAATREARRCAQPTSARQQADVSSSAPASPQRRSNAYQAIHSADEALSRFALDLTDKARRGEIDPVFGRDREIQQMVDVLVRRRKNNPILVGEPGVGKTALVEGLALRVAEGNVPNLIRDVRILTLDLALLQAGAGVKGEFEQRLKNVIDEVRASPVPILIFVDEAHTLIGAGNAAGGADAANLLKPALARGELRTIAATTWSEFKEFFERDAALERRFQIVKVDEPDDEAACLMLRGLVNRYAQYHRVHIRDDALVAAVRLSRRYIPARQLPDKAVDLIDTAAGRVRMTLESPPAELQRARAAVVALELERATLDADEAAGIEDHQISQTRRATLDALLLTATEEQKKLQARYEQELALVTALHARRDAEPPMRDPFALSTAREALADVQRSSPLVFADVDAQAVARVVADWTGIPVGDLVDDELQRLLTLEAQLAQRVVAQDDALAALARSLRTAKAGLGNERAPLGVFLLAGPSGVGKTETVLAIADLLFGGEAALTTINMSEYQEAHTVSQLKGAPPGYVGYGRGGILTEAVRRRPFSVILLDEVEKAHRDVLDLFYQVFDRGTMRDGEGREIDFRHCVILMTSNLGSTQIDDATADNRAISQAELLEAIRPSLTAHFQPALLARFQTLVYRPLDLPALASILRLKLAKLADRLRRQHDVLFACDEALVDALAQHCVARDSGARSIDAFIDQRILPTVARELLVRIATGTVPAEVRLSGSPEGKLTIDFIERDIAQSRRTPPITATATATT